MPTNPITAPSYAKFKYTRTATGQQHEGRLYFQNDMVVNGDNALELSGTTNPDTSDPWLVHDVIKEIMDRINADNGQGALTIDSVEGWDGAADPNAFIGLDGADYTDVVGGIGAVVGAAYYCWTFRDVFRNTFKFFLFDTPLASPTNFHLAVPTVDDGKLPWFFIYGSAGLATNDGNDLRNLSSLNTGYNDKLADNYGRAYNS